MKVIAVLASRLDSEVQLDSLHLRVLPRLRAEGTGLTIRHKGRQDVPPLISVRSFARRREASSAFSASMCRLVTLEGLDIQIPPRDRDAMKPNDNEPANEADKANGANDGVKPPFVIDKLITTDAKLVDHSAQGGQAAEGVGDSRSAHGVGDLRSGDAVRGDSDQRRPARRDRHPRARSVRGSATSRDRRRSTARSSSTRRT